MIWYVFPKLGCVQKKPAVVDSCCCTEISDTKTSLQNSIEIPSHCWEKETVWISNFLFTSFQGNQIWPWFAHAVRCPSSALEVFRCLRLLRGFLCSVCGSTAGMARGGNGTVYGSMAAQWLSGWRFGTCLFFHILGIVTPTDINWLIFFRGVGIPPTSYLMGI